MFQPLCLGGRGLGPSRLFSIFQRGCQVRKRPGATLSLGYELIFLPVPAGEDPMTGIGFALGLICSACPPASWLEHHCTTQLPGVVPSSSGQMRLPGASDSSSCLGMGKWALQLIKLLEDLNQANLHPLQPIIWSECTPDLVLLTSEAAGWGCSSGIKGLSAKICVLVLQALPASLL